MIGRTKLVAVGLAFGLVFAGAACSTSDAAEKLTEKAIENQSGGDVDIDSEDGTVKYTDENGNETEMNVDGSGASLPEDWPADLAPPDSVTLISTGTTTVDGVKTMTVLGEADASVADLGEGVKTQITDAGFDITQDTTSEVTGGGYVGLTATKGDQELTVAIASGSTDDSKATVTMTLADKS